MTMTSVLLAGLSLQFLCHLFVAGAPSASVTRDGTLAGSGVIVQLTPEVDNPTSTRATLQSLPEGYVAFPEDRLALKIHEEGATWYEARDRCIAEGGHLAITDSFQKIRHIKGLKFISHKWLHVGIHKLTNDGEWVRVDNGLPPSFIPWKRDNPDGTGNCAGISFNVNGLLDYPCDWDDEWYVCEISM